MTTTTALIFPGQGSQTVGMGKALVGRFPESRAVFEEVDAALGEKLSAVILEGPEADLTRTANAQPALLATSLAALRAMEAHGGLNLVRDVAMVAGHSLGEYSALAAARAMSIGDAARLLRLRGEAMQDAVPVGTGAMAALIGTDIEAAAGLAREAAAGQVCDVANDNGGGQIVLSGHKDAVERAVALAKGAGIKRAVMLTVSAPFHCGLMRPAAERMAEAIAGIRLEAPVVPLVSNRDATPLTDPSAIRDSLVFQISNTVRWRDCVTAMAAAGVGRFVEVGAGAVLSGLVKRIVPGTATQAVGTPDDVEAFRLGSAARAS